MRTSFIQSKLITNHQNSQPVKLQDGDKFSHLGQNVIQKEPAWTKYNKYLDSIKDISFNLDRMYFESDSSTEQNLKKKPAKSKKCFPNQQEVNSINQEPFPAPKATNNSLKETTFEENASSTSKTSQTSKEQIIKSEALQIERKQFYHLEYNYKQFKEQQIQVDFSQPSSQSGNSLHQLSQIDMLFIFPQNITNYNHDHPLEVTLADLAKIYPLDLQLRNFVRLKDECNEMRKIFEAFMIDWGKSEERLSKKVLTLAKMRTIIIRDAMNNLVDEIVPPVESQDYHFRIGKTYRNRYIKSGIPIPPPRVNNSYLQGLFSLPEIKKYYQNYVEQKLQIYLKQQNYRKIQIYTFDLIQCLKLYHSKNVPQLVEILERKKKPFTNKQIQLIIQEARKIGDDYGKDAKRIGNGLRRKMSYKPQKFHSKNLQQIDSQQNQYSGAYHQNQFFQEKTDDQIQKITRKTQKKVKLSQIAPQVKIEVKIQQTSPKQKPNLIIIETPKVKIQNRYQDKVQNE